MELVHLQSFHHLPVATYIAGEKGKVTYVDDLYRDRSRILQKWGLISDIMLYCILHILCQACMQLVMAINLLTVWYSILRCLALKAT